MEVLKSSNYKTLPEFTTEKQMIEWLSQPYESSKVEEFLIELKEKLQEQAEEGGCAEGNDYFACSDQHWLCEHAYCQMAQEWLIENCFDDEKNENGEDLTETEKQTKYKHTLCSKCWGITDITVYYNIFLSSFVSLIPHLTKK